ncbi:SGNH/GDSL hydrolase family protein [Marinicella litoralis]|nr:SGNH/GDSL hydrolase family protein [Marinicella litoralis]
MIYKYLLGPLLLLQGLWVRKKTPVLPEPVDQTSGSLGHGKPIKLLLLGDSSAAGVGAETAEASLLGQLLKNLAPAHQVNYQMLAKTGQTTAGMIEALKSQTSQSYDVVITALGVNDVTAQVPVKSWLKQQQNLLELIDQKFSPQMTYVSGLPPVREFPALPWPLNAYMGQCADDFNTALIALCDRQDRVMFHSLRGYPPEAQAAVDGFHPGPKVYALWAQYLSDDIAKSVIECQH